MGKSTISMAISNSKLLTSPEGKNPGVFHSNARPRKAASLPGVVGLQQGQFVEVGPGPESRNGHATRILTVLLY